MNKNWLILVCILWFFPRLIHINNPILGIHSWRQSDTSAIARSFYREHNSIFEPRIEWRENKPGLVETEFQIYPYAISKLYKIFGEHDFLGRTLALIIASFGALYFFLFLKELYGFDTALIGTTIYSILPTSIYYNRTIMPEALVLTCIVGGLFHFYRFLKRDNWQNIVSFAIWFALLGTVKFFHFYVCLALAFMAHDHTKFKVLQRKQLWLAIFVIIASSIAWWWRAHLNYLEGGFTFGIWGEKQDKILNWDMLFQSKYWHRVLVEWIATRHLTLLLAPLFLLALAQIFKFKFTAWMKGFLIGFFIFLLIVVLGNYVHEYYSLPILFPACAAIALLINSYLTKVPRLKHAMLPALAVAIVYSARLYYNEYYLKELAANSAEYQLSQKIKELTPPSQLISVALNSYNPNIHYLSDRKGCRMFIFQLFDPTLVSSFIKKGCNVFVAPTAEVADAKKTEALESLLEDSQIILRSDKFVIFSFRTSSP